LRQPRQDGASSRVGQRTEGAVQVGGITVNHMVNYHIGSRFPSSTGAS
jgi:hypothetical protein